MLIKQKIYNPTTPGTSPRTWATDKTMGQETGLTLGEKVEIYAKGDTLFYTQDFRLPKANGFKLIATRKVFRTQNRAQISLPTDWTTGHCKDMTHVRAYYTKIGLFIRPFYGGLHG